MLKKFHFIYSRPGANFVAAQNRKRFFYTVQHSAPEPRYKTIDGEILKAAFTHVPKHGFSKTALLEGSRDLGYPDISTNLFSSGAFDLVKYHLVTQRQQLAQKTDFVKLQETLGRAATPMEKLRLTLITRLKGNEPVIQHWTEVLPYSATELSS